MSEHTPGPWTIDNVRHDRKADLKHLDIRGPGRPRGPSGREYRDIIGEVFTDWGTHDEVDANARLIAAAPELLGALEGLLHELPQPEEGDAGDGFDAIRRAHAVVAQARGRSVSQTTTTDTKGE